MLSINIPVYNIDANNLVQKLSDQAKVLKIPYEIRVYDDGSSNDWKLKNRPLGAIPNIIYREMEHNLGRAAIRNALGMDSIYPYLLFIDADSDIISESYLNDYLKQTNPQTIICGGTAYSKVKPPVEKLLRWTYGTQREAIPAKERDLQKGFIITSNNFLIDRDTFRKIHFRTNLGPYGHEDTLLGYDLFKAGITPQHIDNPVEHTGLEDSNTFLGKTEEALKNLLLISEQRIDSPDFSENIRLLNRYKKLTRGIPPMALRWGYCLFKNAMKKNLTGRNPRLLLFDIYKICYFATLKR